TGALRLALAEVPLRGLVGEVVELYEDVAEHKRVALRVDDGEDVAVSADRDRLRQAVANLVDNAIKYTPEGGAGRVAVGRADGAATLTVSDTGIGIPAADQPRIWDRLYRGDRSRTERGLGLGLSIVRAYIRAHGGDVTVTSEPGHGSRFEIRLPARITRL